MATNPIKGSRQDQYPAAWTTSTAEQHRHRTLPQLHCQCSYRHRWTRQLCYLWATSLSSGDGDQALRKREQAVLSQKQVAEVLKTEGISKKVERPTRELLRFLAVHQVIQVWFLTYDDRIEILSWDDPDYNEKVGLIDELYATSRSVLGESLGKTHHESSILRSKIVAMAQIDWKSASGREFDYFVEHGRWDNPPVQGDPARHNHYLPTEIGDRKILPA